MAHVSESARRGAAVKDRGGWARPRRRVVPWLRPEGQGATGPTGAWRGAETVPDPWPEPNPGTWRAAAGGGCPGPQISLDKPTFSGTQARYAVRYALTYADDSTGKWQFGQTSDEPPR
jgi:hypothetical protein